MKIGRRIATSQHRFVSLAYFALSVGSLAVLSLMLVVVLFAVSLLAGQLPCIFDVCATHRLLLSPFAAMNKTAVIIVFSYFLSASHYSMSPDFDNYSMCPYFQNLNRNVSCPPSAQ